MKIVLVALNAKYVHSNLAVYDLEAYFKKHNPQVDCELEVCEYTINHNLDLILQALYKQKANVYAFSCYIWNIREVLTITNELKKLLPESLIWLGGPEASYGADKYLKENKELEGIMVGEGEATFAKLMKIWVKLGIDGLASENRKKDPYEKINGIVYRKDNGGITENKGTERIDLDDIPFVYKDLSKFENRIIYYETSRGCPFSCSYCLSSIDKAVRFRSFEIVRKELDSFLERKVPQVKFIDRTFNCNKIHAREIWRYISEHDNGVTNFHFEVAADLIEDEDIEIFKSMREGLIQLEIGLQSTNIQTIEAIRRKMDIGSVKDTLLKIRNLGNIHQHLDLIAGLPYEGFESFRKSFNDAMEMKPNQLQLGFLKVLKGSYMGEMTEEYDIKHSDVQPFEVLSTKWIDYDEIMVLKNIEEMVEVYYNSDQFEYTLPYVTSFFKSQFDFYKELGDYYEKKNLFGIGFKRENRYITLIKFMEKKIDDAEKHNGKSKSFKMITHSINKNVSIEFDYDLFIELLTFDYYLRENAKSRPMWLKSKSIYSKDKTTHIESMSDETYNFIMSLGEVYIEIDDETGEKEKSNHHGEYVLAEFNYNKRSRLSHNAAVKFYKK